MFVVKDISMMYLLQKCFAMLVHLPVVFCRPHSRSDIIAGEDFLALFMSASNEDDRTDLEVQASTMQYDVAALRPISRGSRSSRYEKEHSNDLDRGVKIEYLPLEAMFTTVKQKDDIDDGSEEDDIEMRKISDDIQQRLRRIYTQHQEINSKTSSEQTRVKDTRPAQVIAVSVSSSVGVSRVHKNPVTEKVVGRNKVSAADDAVVISKNKKSDFNIDEGEPTTKEKDYIQGESTNKHAVITAPGANEAYLEQQRTRHQRRQEPMHPYHQTIIFHNENKEGAQARSVSYSSVVQSFNPSGEWKGTDAKDMPVSKNITDFDEDIKKFTGKIFNEPAKNYGEPEKIYSEPAKIYSEPAKVYGQPEKIYSEPAKVYGEPAKIYSEPAKIYSEPAKIYSEPAKIYGEPAKVYSEPEKPYQEPSKFGAIVKPIVSVKFGTHISPDKEEFITHPVEAKTKTDKPTQVPPTIVDYSKKTYDELNAPREEVNFESKKIVDDGSYRPSEHEHVEQNWEEPEQDYRPVTPVPRGEQYESTPEQNYEVDEAVSVQTNGRAHGVQSPKKKDDENQKVGYVVEGRNFRKYRVEERTADGFIVGEYGVVSHDDGSLRGVRYTADGTTNPRLIYDALMKFLSL
ncbi:uncharacterized protein LOC113376748 isoform X1 [Ctenocephalides felis]|uniref:uncharacterized protein LOC113376748 isoform X1 n=1 Tax=Ctenocephalides felis TaxID=7515 RepID=UPI000E6E3E5F|nr:uncharacterized protein LOC113376748 isoform X1 [Ctenocephalides felis]